MWDHMQGLVVMHVRAHHTFYAPFAKHTLCNKIYKHMLYILNHTFFLVNLHTEQN